MNSKYSRFLYVQLDKMFQWRFGVGDFNHFIRANNTKTSICNTKITEKNSFIIASEASYVYILSGQTVLPDRSILKGQTLVENVKIEKLKCDILGDFQTMWVDRSWVFIGIHYFEVEETVASLKNQYPSDKSNNSVNSNNLIWNSLTSTSC